jgi:hypothetical protein
MHLNAEICNGHGTFPDKFSISDPPFPTRPFPTHFGAGNAGGNAPRATNSNGCNRYFDAAAGKRLSKSLADLAEADDCVTHLFSFGS